MVRGWIMVDLFNGQSIKYVRDLLVDSSAGCLQSISINNGGTGYLTSAFELFVVFATNLLPATLADPAFLRRIQTKIKVGTVSSQNFHEIFRRVCSGFGLQYEAGIVDELIHVIQDKLKEPLRACHPRDLVNQIRWAAQLRGAGASLGS